MVKNNQVFVGGALVFKDTGRRHLFLITKGKAGDWEIPKATARRGESSVRAAIRLTGEQMGMDARVLEEVGRATGAVTVNGRVINQKIYYYIMIYKSAGEIMGFEDTKWFDFVQAKKSVSLKKEKEALDGARRFLKEWAKKKEKS